MCRSRTAPATGSISAATPSRKSPCATALDLLKPILEDDSVLKIVQNAKFDMVALARYGIALTPSTIPA